MRKGHIKLLEKARTLGFSEKELNIIEMSDLALEELSVLVDMIAYLRKNYDDNAEDMLTACINLAGCESARPWLLRNNSKISYYCLLDRKPSISEL